MSAVNVTILLGLLTGILLAIGWVIGGFFGMTLALIFSIVVNFLSYWYSDKIVLKMYGAKPFDDPKIQKMVKDLAHDAKIPTPRLYLLDTDRPNAFATGRNPRTSVIAVTKGLLHLEDDELKGVLAHEMGHIMNRDILIGSMAATIAGAISYIAHIGYWSLFFGGNRRDEGGTMWIILIVIFAPLAALLVRMAISRSREYKADYTSALLTKDPRGLASALKKIEATATRHPFRRGSSATAHMWIANPFKRDWFSNLFATHPPMSERIARLDEVGANKGFHHKGEKLHMSVGE